MMAGSLEGKTNLIPETRGQTMGVEGVFWCQSSASVQSLTFQKEQLGEKSEPYWHNSLWVVD